MNKFILFSNIKGGVGKTTLSAHFTEYLAEHEYPVAAVDADLQASLSRHRERDVKEDPKRPLPWEVIKLNTFDGEKVKAVVKKLKQVDGIIVVDCPGNLNDNNLSILLSAARPSCCSCPTASTFQKAEHKTWQSATRTSRI